MMARVEGIEAKEIAVQHFLAVRATLAGAADSMRLAFVALASFPEARADTKLKAVADALRALGGRAVDAQLGFALHAADAGTGGGDFNVSERAVSTCSLGGNVHRSGSAKR